MREWVLINEAGDLAIGVKLHMFDNPDEKLMDYQLGKIAWLPDKPDFWGLATFEGSGFVLMPYDFVMTRLECLGEL